MGPVEVTVGLILLISKIRPVTTASSTYRAWQRLSGHPGGTRLFSFAAMVRVPYFTLVLPHVRHMEPGLAEVDVPTWFFVQSVEVVPLDYWNGSKPRRWRSSDAYHPRCIREGGSGGC
jgi:hypothetical protein